MEFFIYSKDRQVGPLSKEELKSRIRLGEFSSSDLVHLTGTNTWQRISEIPGLLTPDLPNQNVVELPRDSNSEASERGEVTRDTQSSNGQLNGPKTGKEHPPVIILTNLAPPPIPQTTQTVQKPSGWNTFGTLGLWILFGFFAPGALVSNGGNPWCLMLAVILGITIQRKSFARQARRIASQRPECALAKAYFLSAFATSWRIGLGFIAIGALFSLGATTSEQSALLIGGMITLWLVSLLFSLDAGFWPLRKRKPQNS